MLQENIRHVLVWSGWVRLTHWLIACGVLFLFASAWALELGASDYEFWRDWHMICGQMVLLAVVGRLILMFILPGSAHWTSFLPDRAQLAAMGQMVKFYLSFARFPLPNWYAHNPFWRQLYPLILLILLGCAFAGMFYNAPYTFLGFSMFKLHGGLADTVLFFVIAHVIAAFLHDLKGRGASISGMISGYRYFHVEGQGAMEQGAPQAGKPSVTKVSVDAIQRPPKP